MDGQEREAGTAIVRLPAEIDMSNTGEIGAELSAAAQPGVTVIVGDLTGTTFCDSSGVRQLVLAYDKVAAGGAELRLAVAQGAAVDRILRLIGLDQLVPLYPSVADALADGRGRPDS